MASIINATLSNGLVTSADNSGSLQLATNNGTTAVTIDTSQNVGIGTTTNLGKLTAQGTITAKASADESILSISHNGSEAVISASYGSTGSYDPMVFKTSDAERMRITSGGNVLVGSTTDDGFKFKVVGGNASNFLVDNGGQQYTQLLLQRNSTGNTGGDILIDGSASTMNIRGLLAGAMTFQTSASAGSPVERMRILSSGYVIVSGTSTNSDNATYQGFGEFVSRRASSAGTLHAAFINGGNQVGSITSSTTTTFYNTTSDYRLKENVTPMVGALNKVAQLKPCTYTWKLNGSTGQGFIAHELKEVVPDAVYGEKDAVDKDGKPTYQGVDTSYLVATLTAAIQELKAQLDESNLILTSVKTELDATKAEVQALKGTL